jgi:hypothetical protein
MQAETGLLFHGSIPRPWFILGLLGFKYHPWTKVLEKRHHRNH